MADPTSLMGKARMAEPLACYGIVFVADSVEMASDLLRAPSMALPQIASPGLDSTFLINCQQALSGARLMKDLDGLAVRRVAGTRRRGSTAIHLFACAPAFRDLLAALTERRARDLAVRWPTLTDGHSKRPPKLSEKVSERTRSTRAPSRLDGRTQHRVTLLNELAGLSRLAKTGDRSLMLRVEYHRRRNP